MQPTCPTPQSAGPGARALYLGQRERKRVSCTDEALVIVNQRAQTTRYPLARLARIVSSPQVDWSGAALALCLRRGIAITWIDTQGQTLGSGYPQRRSDPAFSTALELLLQGSDGLALYRNWRRSRRMEVLLRWGKTSVREIEPQEWEATKRSWVYAAELTVHLPAALRGHCQAWVAAQLAQLPLPPIWWGPQGERIDLDEDLTQLLWAELNLCTGSVADGTEGERELVHLFESWHSGNGSALLLHLSSLHRLANKAVYGST